MARINHLVPGLLALLTSGCLGDGATGDAGETGRPDGLVAADVDPRMDAVMSPDAAVPGDSAQPDGPDDQDPFAGELDVSLQFASGARLLATKRVSSGGTPLFDGWYDSQLQVGCKFRSAADGVQRCLPSQPRGEVGWGSAYADATCSKSSRLLRYFFAAGTACVTAVPAYWVTASGVSDSCNAEVYPVSGSLTPRPYYLRSADGTCKSPGSMLAVDLGAPLPPTSFVPATLVDGPAQAGVVPRYLVAADGARGFAGWQDPVRGEACELRRATDGAFRCLSSHEGDTLHFADSGCTKPGFSTSWCAPAPSSVAVSQPGCPTTYEAREVGAATQTSRLYLGPSCDGSYTSSSTRTVYEMGPLIPLDSFPAAAEAPAPDRRLTQTVLVLGSLQQSIGDLAFFDSVRNEHCAFFIAGDDKLRCLPHRLRGGTWANTFSDSACTSPLLTYDVVSPHCEANAGLVAISDRSACPVRRRIFAVGPPHSGAVYRLDASGACTQDTTFLPSGFLMGAEVPPTSFEEAS